MTEMGQPSSDRLTTEVLSIVAHELRTPLGAIKGYASLLRHSGTRIEWAEAQSFLAEIEEAADRLVELVEHLTDLTRLEAGTLRIVREPIALAVVLRAAVADVWRQHPDRQILLVLADSLPILRADPRRLRQVAVNLLDNAIKYSPADAVVVLRAWAASDQTVAFAVEDAGIGIPPEHQARVFERFYRVDNNPTRSVGGTGLGLAICRGIVEAHGGRLTLESTPGKGSTFTVTLPAAR